MENHKNNITKTASADMARGTVVKLDASDASKVAACSAADSDAIGVANHTVEAVAAGAIAAGAKVCLAASGKVAAYPAATSSAQSVVCVGIALTSAYADGNVVEIAHRAPTPDTVAAVAG